MYGLRDLLFVFCLMSVTDFTNIADFLQHDPDTLPDEQPAFLEHLLAKMDDHIAKKGRILLLTLTKRSSEEITNFLVSK